MIRLAHVWSSDLGIPAGLPYCLPLLERGWQITVITPDGPNVPLAGKHGLTWRPLALARRMSPGSDVAGTLQLWRYLGADVDIVHTHNIKAGHIGRVVATARRVPIVVHTIHGMAYGPETPRWKHVGHAFLERVASTCCHAILAQGQEDRDTLVASRAAPADKITVIGNGIDLSRFDPEKVDRAAARAALGLADDEVLFFSAGRLIREKGFLELFAAAAAARAVNPRIRLAIAGAADARSDTLTEADLGAARAAGVMLLGRRDDMPALHAASDVVVLPSWHEGMPRVLIEGAAMGRPLIASDVRGCREVTPPEVGLRVPVRDAPALTCAMLDLAADPARRARLGAAGRARALREHDLPVIVARVTAVYDRLLGGRGIG